MVNPITNSVIDCACVIHSDGYQWQYVDKLYNMIQRHLSLPFKLHVFTEHNRTVPEHIVKHSLLPWPGISGHKKSWWYKLQLFNPAHVTGNLLYIDLDTVIVNSIDWIVKNDPTKIWAVRDFKYLQGQRTFRLNSSVMWWNVERFSHVWQQTQKFDVQHLIKKYNGDQDFLDDIIDMSEKRFFSESAILSYRWQCVDGGYNFKLKKYNQPGLGVHIDSSASIVTFHGKPKPHEVQDQLIQHHWI